MWLMRRLVAKGFRYGELPIYVISLLHAIILGLPLFFIPIFPKDWVNHLWFANYVATHLASNLSMPMFVNVENNVGNPILVFYGSGLYAALFPFVKLLGPDIGMRLAVFLALLFPNLALLYLIRRCSRNMWIAACTAIVLTTSVYQLTNIYTRAAMTEFFAYQFLMFSLLMVMNVFVDGGRRADSVKIIVGIACAGLGVLCHPPTAYVAVLFLGLPFAALIFPYRRIFVSEALLAWLCLVAFLVAIVPVGLWGWLTIANSGDLALNFVVGHKNLHFFPWSIDHWLARFAPWPMDFRIEIEGFNPVSTPYLSAPMNTAGLLLFLCLLIGRVVDSHALSAASRRTLLIFLLAVLASAVSSLLLSLPFGRLQTTIAPDGTIVAGVFHADPSSVRGILLGRIQFAYRLVNVTNLALVLGCLGLLVLSRDSRIDGFESNRGLPWGYAIVGLAVTVCLQSALIKIVEVYKEYNLLPRYTQRLLHQWNKPEPTTGLIPWVSAQNVQHLLGTAIHDILRAPITQYGLGAYSMPKLYSAYEKNDAFVEVNMPLTPQGASRAAGNVRCERACALITNLLTSPFFTLLLDGEIVPSRDFQNRDGVLVVETGAGDHRLEVELGSWLTRLLSHALLILVGFFWTASTVMIFQALGFRSWFTSNARCRPRRDE
jgi:hypothetical protein